MKHIIRLISALIVIGAIVVLTLILILWIRERTYEIGILLSIGFSKSRIMSQFILELVFISLPALIVALLSGSILISQLLLSQMRAPLFKEDFTSRDLDSIILQVYYSAMQY